MSNNKLPSLEIYLPREVEIHYKRPVFETMVYINNPTDANKYLRTIINLHRIDHKEFFWLLMFNNANRLLGFAEIGIGSDKGVIINTKEIFQLILKSNAAGFSVAHNHPSGNLKPSQHDLKFTERLKELSKLLDVHFIDHLIITSESYYSMEFDKEY